MAILRWIKEISDRFTMQKACDKAVHTNRKYFFYIPDRFKAQEMCIKEVEKDPSDLRFVHEKPCIKYILDHLKTQEMCEKAIEKDLRGLNYVPDHLKTQEMCNNLMCNYYFFLFLTVLKPKRHVLRQLRKIHLT